MADETSPLHSPANRDLVVIGASAGGVETLKRVVAGLPGDLRATVCIVLHIAPDTPSLLAKILGRAGPLPCRAVGTTEALRRAEILVAPPDHHLVVEDGRVKLSVGPRENGHRPAVDVLFRSAAQARGRHVIGVVLSGTRGDGALGLAAIKAAGGATIVQDPNEALYAGMPTTALAHVSVDAVVPSEFVAQAIVAMINGEDPPPGSEHTDPQLVSAAGEAPPASSQHRAASSAGSTSAGGSMRPPDGSATNPVETTICPECGGVLTERDEASTKVWQCRVGHRYSPEALVDAQAVDVESALWAAVRALEDRGRLLDRMADELEPRGHARSVRSFREKARAAREQGQAVREALMRTTSLSLSQEPDDDAEAAGF